MTPTARRPGVLALLALAACAPALAASGCSTSGSGGSGGTTHGSSSSGVGGKTASSSESVSSSPGSSSSQSSTSTGTGGAAGACTDAADEAIVASVDVPTLAANCAKMNLGQDPAIEACIEAGTRQDGGPGLSAACTQCFDAAVDCSIAHCPNQCLSDPGSATCVACRAQSCDPAFYACSGLPQPSPDGG